MSDTGKRMQEVLAALLAKRLEDSLAQVEAAIWAWRKGESDAATAHGETVRHTQRAQALGTRIARAGVDGPQLLLRDALELGLIDEAEFVTLAGKPSAEVPPPPPLDEDSGREFAAGLPPKRDVLEKLLEDGPVLIHLDARHAGVEVPDAHRDNARLVLRLGFGLSPPIPDLSFDDHGVRATLTFRGKPHPCMVPWDAVYAVVAEDGRGLVWPEHVPPDVAAELEQELRGQRAPRGPARAPSADKRRGGASSAAMSIVPGGPDAPAEGSVPPSPDGTDGPDKPKRPPHLRLV
jgi:stringent starvation protein B